MAHAPDPRKQRRWLQLVLRWQRSQLSVPDFCRRHHLKLPSFYAWRRALRQRGLLTPLTLPPPDSAWLAAPPESSPSFVSLALPADSASPPSDGIDLVVGQRLLRIRPGFDANTLRRLVHLLEDTSC
jgi:hypothetical protein